MYYSKDSKDTWWARLNKRADRLLWQIYWFFDAPVFKVIGYLFLGLIAFAVGMLITYAITRTSP